MPHKSSATTLKHEAARRKRRQGSETRDMTAVLRVRYDQDGLQALTDQAGKRLPALIRQYGELLTELLPVADEQGIDPIELIRQSVTTLLDDRQAMSQRAAS